LNPFNRSKYPDIPVPFILKNVCGTGQHNLSGNTHGDFNCKNSALLQDGQNFGQIAQNRPQNMKIAKIIGGRKITKFI
jgi:hypothetical protein